MVPYQQFSRSWGNKSSFEAMGPNHQFLRPWGQISFSGLGANASFSRPWGHWAIINDFKRPWGLINYIGATNSHFQNSLLLIQVKNGGEEIWWSQNTHKRSAVHSLRPGTYTNVALRNWIITNNAVTLEANSPLQALEAKISKNCMTTLAKNQSRKTPPG